MASLSPWSPYVKKYYPSLVIMRLSDSKPVATVDTPLFLAKGYTTVAYSQGPSGLGAAMPESVVYEKKAILDEAGNVVAIVEGIGKIFPGFRMRSVTAAEAALSGESLENDAGIF